MYPGTIYMHVQTILPDHILVHIQDEINKIICLQYVLTVYATNFI